MVSNNGMDPNTKRAIVFLEWLVVFTLGLILLAFATLIVRRSGTDLVTILEVIGVVGALSGIGVAVSKGRLGGPGGHDDHDV